MKHSKDNLEDMVELMWRGVPLPNTPHGFRDWFDAVYPRVRSLNILSPDLVFFQQLSLKMFEVAAEVCRASGFPKAHELPARSSIPINDIKNIREWAEKWADQWDRKN